MTEPPDDDPKRRNTEIPVEGTVASEADPFHRDAWKLLRAHKWAAVSAMGTVLGTAGGVGFWLARSEWGPNIDDLSEKHPAKMKLEACESQREETEKLNATLERQRDGAMKDLHDRTLELDRQRQVPFMNFELNENPNGADLSFVMVSSGQRAAHIKDELWFWDGTPILAKEKQGRTQILERWPKGVTKVLMNEYIELNKLVQPGTRAELFVITADHGAVANEFSATMARIGVGICYCQERTNKCWWSKWGRTAKWLDDVVANDAPTSCFVYPG